MQEINCFTSAQQIAIKSMPFERHVNKTMFFLSIESLVCEIGQFIQHLTLKSNFYINVNGDVAKKTDKIMGNRI